MTLFANIEEMFMWILNEVLLLLQSNLKFVVQDLDQDCVTICHYVSLITNHMD